MTKNELDSDNTVVSLKENVAEVMKHYFANLKGEEPRNVYDFFLDEIEEPLLTVVMKYVRNNQSKLHVFWVFRAEHYAPC